MTNDEKYISRCIQLAKNGWMNSQPNPMVGAVIVYNDTIIGEGYHVRCGEGHAEVNACASVLPENEHLLKDSTIYVSLEPCSHYGKTPPCAELLVSKGFKRCVVGCMDPFAKVQGRGIKRLRDAGMEVTVGVLEEECKALNTRFMTFHGKQRPLITLKWAQSADGFIDGHISTPYTQMVCHKRRAEHQAILVGHSTWTIDNPGLDVRSWVGKNPKIYVAGNHFTDKECIEIESRGGKILGGDVNDFLHTLYEDGVQTLLVEGGAKLLQSFIDSGLWDSAYIETGSAPIHGNVKAPNLYNATLKERQYYMGRIIEKYVL
ncbi:MAG: bifunctional diaminohydroxyphosphoribosylaminopyrimidine deaminase/5-amino-6-(5-phosphoribosylamino)uracil reductase RibD [Bacteroidaceae bacterium]|nr:bifunctional diaminohydroxyphosphoribosylaminopyrimidine deaminase/5-amino-6-(5-phosphoribosylamino)uracil reductase RibD [Bacteroidaceae bacterium]